jgi:hypothetical protein
LLLRVAAQGDAAAAGKDLTCRATTRAAAIERLCSSVPRSALVRNLAGMEAAVATIPGVTVIKHYPGTRSTDLWGISFALSSIEQQALSDEALERELPSSRPLACSHATLRPERGARELLSGP